MEVKGLEKLKEFLLSNEIDSTRIQRMENKISTSSLPNEGRFTGVDVIKGTNKAFNHVVMQVEGTDKTCSLSRIRAIMNIEEELSTVAKNGKYLLKVKPLNPQFTEMSTLELMDFLQGKKFKAEKVEGYIRPFDTKENKQCSFESKEQALETAEFYSGYKITIIPENKEGE